MKKLIIFIAFVLVLSSCASPENNRPTPGAGEAQYEENNIDKGSNETVDNKIQADEDDKLHNAQVENVDDNGLDEGDPIHSAEEGDFTDKEKSDDSNSSKVTNSSRPNKGKKDNSSKGSFDGRKNDKKSNKANKDQSEKTKNDRTKKKNNKGPEAGKINDDKELISKKPSNDNSVGGLDSKDKAEKGPDGSEVIKDKENEDNKDNSESQPNVDSDLDNHDNGSNNKTPNEEGEEKPAPVEKKLISKSIYLGKHHVKYLDVGIDNYNIKKTQKLIDEGNIISTVTKFNPNDNEITYFSGHTYNYKSVARLKKGSIVTVTDANGLGYKYKIVDFKKYRAGDVESDAPFIGGYHLIDLAGEGIGVESIAIQYCDENDIPIIFLGLPA